MSAPRAACLVGLGVVALLLSASVLSARSATAAWGHQVSQPSLTAGARACPLPTPGVTPMRSSWSVQVVTGGPCSPAHDCDPAAVPGAVVRLPILGQARLPAERRAAAVIRPSGAYGWDQDASAHLARLLAGATAEGSHPQPPPSDGAEHANGVMLPSGQTTNSALRFLHLGSGWQGQALRAPEGDG